MWKMIVAGSLALAGVSVASPASAYWYPAPYYYGYRPTPVYFGPPVVPFVPYYRPRVVYVPRPNAPEYVPENLPEYAPAYVAPRVYSAPPVRRAVRQVRSAPRPVARARILPEPLPFAGPGRGGGVMPVALPGPLPTLGAPTLPKPAEPAAPVAPPQPPPASFDTPFRGD